MFLFNVYCLDREGRIIEAIVLSPRSFCYRGEEKCVYLFEQGQLGIKANSERNRNQANTIKQPGWTLFELHTLGFPLEDLRNANSVVSVEQSPSLFSLTSSLTSVSSTKCLFRLQGFALCVANSSKQHLSLTVILYCVNWRQIYWFITDMKERQASILTFKVLQDSNCGVFTLLSLIIGISKIII